MLLQLLETQHQLPSVPTPVSASLLTLHGDVYRLTYALSLSETMMLKIVPATTEVDSLLSTFH